MERRDTGKVEGVRVNNFMTCTNIKFEMPGKNNVKITITTDKPWPSEDLQTILKVNDKESEKHNYKYKKEDLVDWHGKKATSKHHELILKALDKYSQNPEKDSEGTNDYEKNFRDVWVLELLSIFFDFPRQ